MILHLGASAESQNQVAASLNQPAQILADELNRRPRLRLSLRGIPVPSSSARYTASAAKGAMASEKINKSRNRKVRGMIGSARPLVYRISDFGFRVSP